MTDQKSADYKKAFDLLDKDGNGTISTSELGEAMRSTGLDPSDDDLKEMIKKADADKSGTLNLSEFQSLVVSEVNKSAMNELRKVFSSYDKNNDGSITVEEARIVLKQQGESDENIEEAIKLMFKGTDINKDDKLIFEGQKSVTHVQQCTHSYGSSPPSLPPTHTHTTELLLNYLFAPVQN